LSDLIVSPRSSRGHPSRCATALLRMPWPTLCLIANHPPRVLQPESPDACRVRFPTHSYKTATTALADVCRIDVLTAVFSCPFCHSARKSAAHRIEALGCALRVRAKLYTSSRSAGLPWQGFAELRL